MSVAPTHTHTILTIRNVSYAYGETPVLQHISLDIHEGDYVGMVGPNGGGKTTLLKIMLGLLKPDEGSVELFHAPIERFKNWPDIAYIPQTAAHVDPLFPATAAEIVLLGRVARRGLGRRLTAEDYQAAEQALEEVDMANEGKKRIGELSPGERQRILIARALAGAPKIMFLDEPTVGVDLQSQEQFYTLLRHLNADLHVTLVLVSHDIDMVAKEVTELACINGRLVCHGTPDEFVKGEHFKDLYGESLRYVKHKHLH